MKKQILLLAMVLMSSLVNAHDIEVKNADGVTIYYDLINRDTELSVSYRGFASDSYGNEYSGDVVIPEEVTYGDITRKVTAIGEEAFKRCYNLTSVNIPDGVTKIGDNAFRDCYNLTSVNIPEGVTSLGTSAFEYCKNLISINIPNSVTSLGTHVFYMCSSLTSASIPSSVTKMGDGVFRACSSLTSVTIPDNITSIPRRAFAGCSSLPSVTIPENVTSIEMYAFQSCSSLTSITIPNSVTSIISYAFQYCTNLTSVIIGSGVTRIVYKVFDDANVSTVISLIEEPFAIDGKDDNNRTFSPNTYDNATLYVPKGTIEKYKATDGWKDFVHIEEGLPANIDNVSANTMQIQSEGGIIRVLGCNDEEQICVYSINGTEAGSAVSQNNAATIPTNIQPGSIAIVKVGDKSIKIMMK